MNGCGYKIYILSTLNSRNILSCGASTEEWQPLHEYLLLDFFEQQCDLEIQAVRLLENQRSVFLLLTLQDGRVDLLMTKETSS